MQTYQLRSTDELLEDARILGMRRKTLEQEYVLALKDIESDILAIKAEFELLKTLGRDTL